MNLGILASQLDSRIVYTLTIGSKTGVGGILVYRDTSPIFDGADIYDGETLTIIASPATGYNNPTVTSPITVSGNVTAADYVTPGSIKRYNVTWVRAWNSTTIKTDTNIPHGSNATFPTEAEIGYGAGYMADGYDGSYTNVTSNRTVTIYRKLIPKLLSPTIISARIQSGSPSERGLYVTIKNNDLDSVVDLYAANGSSSVTYQGILVKGGTDEFRVTTRFQLPGDYTIYAQVKADGRPDSDLISATLMVM